jgi:DNA repair exonuclease SbcCD ATPase subunit
MQEGAANNQAAILQLQAQLEQQQAAQQQQQDNMAALRAQVLQSNISCAANVSTCAELRSSLQQLQQQLEQCCGDVSKQANQMLELTQQQQVRDTHMLPCRAAVLVNTGPTAAVHALSAQGELHSACGQRQRCQHRICAAVQSWLLSCHSPSHPQAATNKLRTDLQAAQQQLTQQLGARQAALDSCAAAAQAAQGKCEDLRQGAVVLAGRCDAITAAIKTAVDPLSAK